MWQKAQCIEQDSFYYGKWVWVVSQPIYNEYYGTEVYYTNLHLPPCNWLEMVVASSTKLLPETCEDAPIVSMDEWFEQQTERKIKRHPNKRASILMLGNEPKVVVPWKNGEKVYTAGLMAKLHFKYEDEFPLSKQDKQKGNLYWHWVDVDLVDSLDEMA